MNKTPYSETMFQKFIKNTKGAHINRCRQFTKVLCKLVKVFLSVFRHGEDRWTDDGIP